MKKKAEKEKKQAKTNQMTAPRTGGKKCRKIRNDARYWGGKSSGHFVRGHTLMKRKQRRARVRACVAGNGSECVIGASMPRRPGECLANAWRMPRGDGRATGIASALCVAPTVMDKAASVALYSPPPFLRLFPWTAPCPYLACGGSSPPEPHPIRGRQCRVLPDDKLYIGRFMSVTHTWGRWTPHHQQQHVSELRPQTGANIGRK